MSLYAITDHLYISLFAAALVLGVLTRKPGVCIFMFLSLAGVVYGVQRSSATPPVIGSPGPEALSSDPDQRMLPSPYVFEYHHQHKLKALASYSMTARVLSVLAYPGEVVPVDVALGWGPMADPGLLSQMTITQGGRFYHYSYSHPLPVSPQKITSTSANNHILPASAGIEHMIESLQKGQVVGLGGYLVNIEDPDGYHWNTSLTRDDSGMGACELFYVQSVTVFNP